MAKVTSAQSDDSLARLRESYGEVLDATKHQDEKIGRILAAVSFLTAAALALVSASEIGLGRRFVLDGHKRPLLAYAFAAFVVGVVFSVTLLLSSVTTALTLPRSPTSGGRGRVASLLYFNAIAKTPYEKWEKQWGQDPALAPLDVRLRENYVAETYNLAVRTNYKYGRSREAIAVLRPTLFALGASVVLAAAVAIAPPASADEPLPPVTVGPGLTWSAAGFVALYTFVVMLVAHRERLVDRRAKGEPAAATGAAKWQPVLALAVAPALVAAALVAVSHDAMRLGGIVVLLGAAASEIAMAQRASEGEPAEKPEDVRTGGPMVWLRAFVYVGMAMAFGTVLVVGDVTIAWVAAACVPLVLMGIDLAGVESYIRRDLRDPV